MIPLVLGHVPDHCFDSALVQLLSEQFDFLGQLLLLFDLLGQQVARAILTGELRGPENVGGTRTAHAALENARADVDVLDDGGAGAGDGGAARGRALDLLVEFVCMVATLLVGEPLLAALEANLVQVLLLDPGQLLRPEGLAPTLGTLVSVLSYVGDAL
jgi:hypothetical protein